MAEEKRNVGPEGQLGLGDVVKEEPGGGAGGPGDVEVSAEQIEALMAKKKAAERAALEQEGAGGDGPGGEVPGGDGEKAPEAVVPNKEGPPTPERAPGSEEETKPARRGRPPKAEREAPGDGEPGAAGKPEKGRAVKKGKGAQEQAKPAKKEKAARAPKDKGGGGGPSSGPAAGGPPAPAVPEQPPEPRDASRGSEEKIVYLNLSELHAFKNHPFKVRDDVEMQALVESVKDKGVHQPALVRPREGGGYEIVTGHRRQKASELAGFANMPCIVREMTNDEAKLAMTDDNLRHREKLLPSEKAAALQQQFEAISHQGVAGDDKEGKLSMEIVGKRNGMSGKTVQRYRWLNDLAPELRELMDDGKLSFTPAVEISRIGKDNQKYIAVAIEGEQASPSVSQAQTLRKLDQAGELNHDKIDGILSQPKKEVEDKVIITTAELEKYFGKGTEAREMKDKIIALLDDWKAKQPPELDKGAKKVEKEK